MDITGTKSSFLGGTKKTTMKNAHVRSPSKRLRYEKEKVFVSQRSETRDGDQQQGGSSRWWQQRERMPGALGALPGGWHGEDRQMAGSQVKTVGRKVIRILESQVRDGSEVKS